MGGTFDQLLPRLNDAELRSIFRQDERAIWRYRILAAALLDERSATEIALEFETTAETVRTLRSTFLQTGHLDALRSKRRGAAGHLTRHTPLAQAVARELAADPSATGGEIWRRVSKQLASTGIAVPRRSIYRLIERLRPQAETESASTSHLWAPGLVPTLRAALPLLMLDPPLDLGKSELAEQLMPDRSDPLERGTLLRDLTQQALQSMSPGPSDDPLDLTYRPAQVLVGEAIRGASRETLQQELAIAPATYTRAKRQGLERLAELLVDALRRRQQSSSRAAPPPASPLVGRDELIANLSAQLESTGTALLWGLPLSGKTALAANIAASWLERGLGVVWHVCSGSGIDVLHALLQSYGVTERPTVADIPEIIDDIRDITKRGGLLVLDTYERIADDPVTELLMATLRGQVDRGAFQLLVVSRVLPNWITPQQARRLPGLPDGFARLMWTGFGGAAQDAAHWARLYRRTLGYPGLLEAIAKQQPTSLASYIYTHCTEELSPTACHVLNLLLLSRTPLTYAEIEEQDRKVALIELQRRALVSRAQHHDTIYLQPLFQAHRRELIDLIDQPRGLHLELAKRAQDAGQWLDAATHRVESGDAHGAIDIIGEHINTLITLGQGRVTIDFLNSLLLRLTPSAKLAEIKAHLGAAYLALGDYREATEALTTALELSASFADELPSSNVRRWQRLIAEAHLGMGHWRAALAQAQASMGGERTINAHVSSYERIALTVLQHRIWSMAGQVTQARYWLGEAKMFAQVNDDPLVVALVAHLEGLEAWQQGAAEVAAQHLQRALALLPGDARHNDRCSWIALCGRCLAACGAADQAHTVVQQQINKAQLQGHTSGLAELLITDALIAIYQRAHDQARTQLLQAEHLIDPGNSLLSAEVKLVQGWLALADRATEAAEAYVWEAHYLACEWTLDEIRTRTDLALSYITLAFNDSDTAMLYATRAEQQAGAIGNGRLQALAQACLAAGSISAEEEAQKIMAEDAFIADSQDVLSPALARALVPSDLASPSATTARRTPLM